MPVTILAAAAMPWSSCHYLAFRARWCPNRFLQHAGVSHGTCWLQAHGGPGESVRPFDIYIVL